MLLKAGQSVTVDELLHGLIVQSGNDAAITLALNIAGSEAGFVDLMNKEAKRLGMNNTHFANPVGLPDAQHYSSAYDLALLAAAIVRDYPQHYPLFGLRDYTFNNVTQANRNRLLWIDPYADGMKTGHTETAGYCLVGSVKRDNRRLISVLLGAASDNLRATESQKLLNFGFQYFDAVRLYQKDQPVTRVRIWKGTESHLKVGFRQDLFLTIPKGKARPAQGDDGNAPAHLRAGQRRATTGRAQTDPGRQTLCGISAGGTGRRAAGQCIFARLGQHPPVFRIRSICK